MEIAIIIIALILSSFFSGMEIAFLSSNKLRVEVQKKQSGIYSYVSGIFMRHPGQYISTILVGNNVALVVYSMMMSVVIQRYISNGVENFVLETVISTLLVIFIAEFLPKAIVKSNPNLYLRSFSSVIFIFYILFYPLAKFTTMCSTLLLRALGLKIDQKARIGNFDKVDLASLVDQAADANIQISNENEIKMLQNALDFSDLRVRECMIPRIDIEAVDIEQGLDDLKRVFVSTNFTRIPIYKGSIDNIIGYAHNRELFGKPTKIEDVMREIIYVPESAGVQKLLSQFIKQHKSMAVVIDEFGTTAGLITIEDILEEIFGEIEDEHDADYLVEKQVSHSEYIFSGRQEVDYLNAQYGLDIPVSDQYETLAGFILNHSKVLPKMGDEIIIGHLVMKIQRATSSKISLINLKIRHTE